MRQATNPFPRGSWIVCSGRILGVLNRELLQGQQAIDSATRILVILPDDWEFVRQSALSAHNAPTSTPPNPVPESPTTPRLPAHGGVASRNPFSSPSRGRNGPLPKHAEPAALGITKDSYREVTGPPASAGGEQAPRDTTTTDMDPVSVPSSSTSRHPSPSIPLTIHLDSDATEHGSDEEQLLGDQLASTSATPTRKRKAPDSPGSGRSKRTTAGKRKAQLYN